MSDLTKLFEELQLTADPSVPVKGVLISDDPSAEPGYIYTDSADGLLDLLESRRSEDRASGAGAYGARQDGRSRPQACSRKGSSWSPRCTPSTRAGRAP